MKGILLIIAVLFIILISGCTMPGSEEMRAMSLAAQTIEGQIMAKMSDMFNRFQYCTTQGVIEIMNTLPEAPQLTQEQLQQLDAQMIEIKKCIPSVDIQVKDMTDGIYNVEYANVLPATCTNPQMVESFMQYQPSLIIEVNLNSNSTKVIKGKLAVDPAQIQTMFTQMEAFGDCGLSFMAATTFTTSQTSQVVTPESQ